MNAIIKSFGSVNRLHRRGINICIGCIFEHCASCYDHCIGNNFAECNKQAAQHIKAIKQK